VPDGSSITVDTFTAELDKPTSEIVTMGEEQWAEGVPNAEEFLVQSDPGRYLWLRVTLRGPGTATPAMQAIRLYTPRRSSLEFLPAVFQQDETSRRFLDRLLSIFDTSFAEITTAIDGLGRYLDVMGMPDDWLPWLAGWLDLTLDGAWPRDRQRAVVEQLPWLYARRGTVGGLRRLIRLYTGAPKPWPQIMEHYRFRRWAQRRPWQATAAEVPTPPGIAARYGAADALDAADVSAGAFAFTVLVPEPAIADEAQFAALQRVIDAWRPAGTVYSLCLVAPRMRLGYQATLGIDSVIGSRQAPVLGREAALDYVILGAPAPGYPATPRVGKGLHLTGISI
jgi:phage tail-like protein